METKQIEIGAWYYRMMGFGGSESQYCCVLAKTGRKTPAGMMSLFGGANGGIRNLPVTDIYLAIDEKGAEHEVSANDLQVNGSIGIGSLEIPRFPHRASICGEDARLLVETGRYTEDEIVAEFPYAFKTGEEEDSLPDLPPAPMSEKQAEILRAAFAANVEKKRKAKEEADRKFREDVEAARRRFSYIPCPMTEGKYLRTGEVSRNLRAVLKHEFPGVKFRVSSDSYSGGDSATVRWVDGPAVKDVEAIVDAFQGEQHNVYEDYWYSVTTALSAVCGHFSYTHTAREYEPATKKIVDDFFRAKGYTDDDLWRETQKLLAATTFPNGPYEIEGIVYNEANFGYEIKFKADEKPVTPPPTDDGGNGDSVTVTENKEKHGVEIRFASVPSEAVRTELKSRNFRWNRFGGCWYNRATAENLTYARDLADRLNGNAA